MHLFYSDVTFQPSSEIQCVLFKNARLASLEFSSCSVYLIIFVAPFRVIISVSKQFKVEICERYHKSHHSAMVLYGSALPHKNFSYQSAQRDMNILLFPVTRDFQNCYFLLLLPQVPMVLNCEILARIEI